MWLRTFFPYQAGCRKVAKSMAMQRRSERNIEKNFCYTERAFTFVTCLQSIACFQGLRCTTEMLFQSDPGKALSERFAPEETSTFAFSSFDSMSKVVTGRCHKWFKVCFIIVKVPCDGRESFVGCRRDGLKQVVRGKRISSRWHTLVLAPYSPSLGGAL